MSKIGKQPIEVPSEVTVEINGNTINVVGAKGKLSINFTKEVWVKIEDSKVVVGVNKDSKIAKSNWGTTRMLIFNMIKGVKDGWSKQLELVGTGYRSEVKGNILVLTVGFSHPINIEAPEGVSFKVEKNIITVEGIDKQVVGQIAADIRASRPPEPYKGKGIKYIDEIVRRKAGKAAKALA